MSGYQKGLGNIVAAAQRELSARGTQEASVSSQVQGSELDGAQITIMAQGKRASATFSRREIDDCHQGVTVGVQVEIKRLVSEFGR
jgi:hypothetical protein